MSDAPISSHPCRACGACCAAFRVSLYFMEVDYHGGTVPSELTEPISLVRVAMRGTNQPRPRCEALDGTVGAWTSCRIHAARPLMCREFAAAWEDGTASPGCDEARARHGLPPLTPADWPPAR